MTKPIVIGLLLLLATSDLVHAAISERILHVESQSIEKNQPRMIRWFMDNINGETLRCRGTVLREFIFVLFENGQWKGHLNVYDDARQRRYHLWIWIYFNNKTTGKPVPGGSIGIKKTQIVPGEPQTFGPHGTWAFGKEVYELLNDSDVEGHVYLKCDRY